MPVLLGEEGVAFDQSWWDHEAYRGDLLMAGQSALDVEGRKLLDAMATDLDAGRLEIPPMPKVAMEVVRLLRASDPDVDEISDTVKLDPMLTAQVLRYANSSLFGARHTIDNIYHAVSYLGLKRLKTVVLETALRKLSGDIQAVEWAGREWTYSVHAAAIARRISQRLGLDQETCYLAGLLHDIGRLPLLMGVEKRGGLDSLPRLDHPVEIVLETLHREVGRQVARDWALPPAVLDAIGGHLTGRESDEESLAQFDSTRVAEAAGDLCVAVGLGRDRRPFGVLEARSLRDVGFTRATLVQFLARDLPAVIAEIRQI